MRKGEDKAIVDMAAMTVVLSFLVFKPSFPMNSPQKSLKSHSVTPSA
jgi:hypothetical protein